MYPLGMFIESKIQRISKNRKLNHAIRLELKFFVFSNSYSVWDFWLCSRWMTVNSSQNNRYNVRRKPPLGEYLVILYCTCFIFFLYSSQKGYLVVLHTSKRTEEWGQRGHICECLARLLLASFDQFILLILSALCCLLFALFYL